MVGQWGIPGWNFCHYCCVPAHKNLFSRGGGGVCNYLLDHGHLQIYLWMIIAIQKCALSGEVVHLFVCFLSCSFLIIKLLFTISPGSRFWLSRVFGGVWQVSGVRLGPPDWGCLLSREGGANQYMSLIEWCEVYGNLLSEGKVFCTVNLVQWKHFILFVKLALQMKATFIRISKRFKPHPHFPTL